MSKQLLICLICFSSLVTGCATTTNKSASGVERKQFVLLPSSYVNNMSAQSYVATLKEADNKKKLNTDPIKLERVRTISNRLIKQTTVFRPDANTWKWEVNVEQNDQLNAYCMPGGKIMVFTGLMDKLQTSDDELAAVIGHEIAHALREHGRERMSIAAVQQVGLVGLAAMASTSKNKAAGLGVQAAAMGTTLFFALPNSREQEREADKMGLELSARSGYNPNAAITLWKKMSEQGGSKPPEFLSTHPSNEHRIEDLSAMIPSMMPLYEAAKAK